MEQIPIKLTTLVLSVSSNPIIIMLIIDAILLFIGLFMPPVPVILILGPILLPITRNIGVDPIHFGIVMVFALMIGLLTPPVGGVLYVVANIAKIPFLKIVRSLLPYYVIFLVVLLLLTFFPQIVLFLPRLLN
jgi:TRAP-type C4-dicarboxylate transport system permease large subunit